MPAGHRAARHPPRRAGLLRPPTAGPWSPALRARPHSAGSTCVTRSRRGTISRPRRVQLPRTPGCGRRTRSAKSASAVQTGRPRRQRTGRARRSSHVVVPGVRLEPRVRVDACHGHLEAEPGRRRGRAQGGSARRLPRPRAALRAAPGAGVPQRGLSSPAKTKCASWGRRGGAQSEAGKVGRN